MSKVKHSLSKNQRYMKQYWGVQLDYDQEFYWWDETENKWTLTPNWNLGGIGNTYTCHSVRAFRRRLHEWSKYLPKGTTFRLIGRYVGQDVLGCTN